MEQTIQDIFELTIKKMKEAGTFEHNDYKTLIEESIEYYRQNGRLTDEDNDEFIEDQLLDRWEQARDRLAK
ncbi:MAG: hypothetical protein Q8O93_02920 [bacterium]|nr:hypothetical protein [bacterium]